MKVGFLCVKRKMYLKMFFQYKLSLNAHQIWIARIQMYVILEAVPMHVFLKVAAHLQNVVHTIMPVSACVSMTILATLM